MTELANHIGLEVREETIAFAVADRSPLGASAPDPNERMRQDLLLATMWEDASEEEFAALWVAEVEEPRGKTRTSTTYLVDRLLLPIRDKLPDEHVQVAVYRRRRPVVPRSLGARSNRAKLAAAFGIDAAIIGSGAEAAQHAMATGETSEIRPIPVEA